MLEKLEVKEVLHKFGKNLVKQARTRLTKKGSNDSKELYNSISYDVSEDADFTFDMLERGEYLDKGVRGAGGVRKTTSKFNSRNNKGKLWKINAKNSPFKFGASGGISPKHFKQWASKRGLSEYAVAKVVYHQGIEPRYFYSKPFEDAYEKLPEDIVKAYAVDLESFIRLTLKE